MKRSLSYKDALVAISALTMAVACARHSRAPGVDPAAAVEKARVTHLNKTFKTSQEPTFDANDKKVAGKIEGINIDIKPITPATASSSSSDNSSVPSPGWATVTVSVLLKGASDPVVLATSDQLAPIADSKGELQMIDMTLNSKVDFKSLLGGPVFVKGACMDSKCDEIAIKIKVVPDGIDPFDAKSHIAAYIFKDGKLEWNMGGTTSIESAFKERVKEMAKDDSSK